MVLMMSILRVYCLETHLDIGARVIHRVDVTDVTAGT